jgi:DNA helicase IV
VNVQSPRERAIAHEQAYVDRAYDALDRQRESYTERLNAVRRQAGQENPGELTERDSFATHYEDNLIRLRNVENRLVLGRLDFADHTAEHIGRIGLKDANGDILLLDWRAPQAEPFYQATAAHPGKVVRRRHIQTRFRQVTGVEDELLTASSDVSDLNLTGEGALMAALNQARDGKMTDIVATIQSEQDKVIRSSSRGVLVVQGGPGTGKTAVALHRAAYLLYTQRERLSRTGVLIVGPSPVFLRYIDQVLPSLGESDVVSTTMADLVPGVTVSRTESDAVASLKGKLMWKDIARRAVKTLERPLREPVPLTIDGVTISLLPNDVAEAQRRARRTGLPHNEARETYARFLVDVVAHRIAESKNVAFEDAGWILSDVVSSVDARRAINLHWLPSAATDLLKRLYARPALLKEVAPELTAHERALLERDKSSGFSIADIAIIDEIAERLGPFMSPEERARAAAKKAEAAEVSRYAQETISRLGVGGGIVNGSMLADRVSESGTAGALAERAATDRGWTYGHVIVDEAQELSPMQWEMLIRRCPTRSFTIVGDLDQYPGGSPEGGWRTLLGRLGEDLHEEVLSVSYRTPKTILETAGKVLSAIGSPVRSVRAARELSHSLSLHHTDSENLVNDLPAIVASLCERMDALYGEGGGTLAVIAPDAALGSIADALSALPRLARWTLDPSGTDVVSRIHVVSPRAAKGLEYDDVVLVDPLEIARSGPGNLYVAMTRPTRHLTVVFADELPGGIAMWESLAEMEPIPHS